MKKITAAIAGLGGRGRDTYARYVLEFPDKIEVVAVADIDEYKRNEAAETFKIPADRCFGDVADLLKKEKLADVLFVCTPDDNHYRTSIDALRLGYHLLLEKPVATVAEECKEIAKVANEEKRHVVVCHVLRYSPFYSKVKEIIDSGDIGDIVTINAFEGVGYFHQAHSFVRGNWADTKETCPMIMSKCCHDMDIILWLADRHIKSISSYGSLSYFKPEKAPEGSAKRCVDCSSEVKDGCPYDAEKIYLTNPETGILHGNNTWPAGILAKPTTEVNIRKAIETGPYGRCVFHSDNDTVDHQVVNIEFDDGVTTNFTMTAFSEEVYRTIRVMGTLGIIEGDMRTNLIKTTVYGKDTITTDVSEIASEYGGHGGGDGLMFNSLINLLNGTSDSSLTSIDKSVESHLACLAAERSRLNGGKPEILAF